MQWRTCRTRALPVDGVRTEKEEKNGTMVVPAPDTMLVSCNKTKQQPAPPVHSTTCPAPICLEWLRDSHTPAEHVREGLKKVTRSSKVRALRKIACRLSPDTHHVAKKHSQTLRKRPAEEDNLLDDGSMDFALGGNECPLVTCHASSISGGPSKGDYNQVRSCPWHGEEA